ncbi:hypothetical protein GOODEAATRI_005550 [Goodea atripinnis]|uniref:Uncharacterized protein n=1 Tax=Goodea atripinnis TaxID=208336 RepID=A0ABV0MZ61_9TELE
MKIPNVTLLSTEEAEPRIAPLSPGDGLSAAAGMIPQTREGGCVYPQVSVDFGLRVRRHEVRYSIGNGRGIQGEFLRRNRFIIPELPPHYLPQTCSKRLLRFIIMFALSLRLTVEEEKLKGVLEVYIT